MSLIGIKCVLFDFGDVVCRPQDAWCIEEMITVSGIPEDRFFDCYFGDRHDYDQGLVDGREYWRRLLQKAGRSLDEETIDRLVALDVESWIKADEQIVQLTSMLRESGVKVGVLSNMPIEHSVIFRKRHKWMEELDYLFLSAEFKLIKPMSEIYEYVLDRVDCEAKEILFIDDKEENLKAAAGAGIQGFHFTAEQTVADLEAHFGLGVE